MIILDAQMPGMDGYETAGHIKRRAKSRNIPIIFLTAIGNDPDCSMRGYGEAGATAERPATGAAGRVWVRPEHAGANRRTLHVSSGRSTPSGATPRSDPYA